MAVHDPCRLLERLLVEPNEQEWLEFKRDNIDPEKLGRNVSALANSAMLADRERAFIVYGIEDTSKKKIGTKVRLNTEKQGGEDLHNWLARLLDPRITIEFLDFDCDGQRFSIVVIEPSFDRPVSFSGTEYVRVGQNTRKLREFPERERALWLATGRRKFEDAIALSNQTAEQVFEKLDISASYDLADEEKPTSDAEIINKLIRREYIVDNMEGGYDITNLGAILFAKNIQEFPSISGKAVRVIKYAGTDKRKSESEQEGVLGYAAGFARMLRYILGRIPSEEFYKDGVRRMVPLIPEIAVREVLANALIHQDFTIYGSAPLVEIYSNRVEVTNPGASLIDVDRMIDERGSRNEKLARAMRGLGLCEERGGGLDKALLAIEIRQLPAPDFTSSNNAMRVTLFGPKPFSKMSKSEKMRACYYHSVIRYVTHEYMSNSSLRERFSLSDEEYQSVSTVISQAIKAGRIVPADPEQGKRNARYVPYWARAEITAE